MTTKDILTSKMKKSEKIVSLWVNAMENFGHPEYYQSWANIANLTDCDTMLAIVKITGSVFRTALETPEVLGKIWKSYYDSEPILRTLAAQLGEQFKKMEDNKNG